jgi:hypothetical protein
MNNTPDSSVAYPKVAVPRLPPRRPGTLMRAVERTKRKYVFKSDELKMALELLIRTTMYPTALEKLEIAEKFNVELRSVNDWIKQRRRHPNLVSRSYNMLESAREKMGHSLEVTVPAKIRRPKPTEVRAYHGPPTRDAAQIPVRKSGRTVRPAPPISHDSAEETDEDESPPPTPSPTPDSLSSPAKSTPDFECITVPPPLGLAVEPLPLPPVIPSPKLQEMEDACVAMRKFFDANPFGSGARLQFIRRLSEHLTPLEVGELGMRQSTRLTHDYTDVEMYDLRSFTPVSGQSSGSEREESQDFQDADSHPSSGLASLDILEAVDASCVDPFLAI